jgi:hypothetical protein
VTWRCYRSRQGRSGRLRRGGRRRWAKPWRADRGRTKRGEESGGGARRLWRRCLLPVGDVQGGLACGRQDIIACGHWVAGRPRGTRGGPRAALVGWPYAVAGVGRHGGRTAAAWRVGCAAAGGPEDSAARGRRLEGGLRGGRRNGSDGYGTWM